MWKNKTFEVPLSHAYIIFNYILSTYMSTVYVMYAPHNQLIVDFACCYSLS